MVRDTGVSLPLTFSLNWELRREQRAYGTLGYAYVPHIQLGSRLPGLCRPWGRTF